MISPLPSEGFEQKVYVDPVGLPTVCVGRMDKKLKLGQKFTLDECMEMLAEDWKKHQAQLDAVVKVPYKSEWQQQALTDFTFNVGISNVQSSTLIKLLNQGKHVEACKQLTRWVKAGGKTLRGLVIRRDKTMPYCLGELNWDKQKAYKEFEVMYEEARKELETKTTCSYSSLSIIANILVALSISGLAVLGVISNVLAIPLLVGLAILLVFLGLLVALLIRVLMICIRKGEMMFDILFKPLLIALVITFLCMWVWVSFLQISR